MSIGRVPGATGIQPSIVTAKGDLIVATASGSVTNQAVGSNNQVLTADSAQADGVKWANGSAATLTTTGDILYASAANTPARLGIGSTDQVLKVSGGVPVWGATPTAAFKGVYLTKSAAQSVSPGTYTAITFENESFDTDGFHNTSTNTSRITIPSGLAGYYLVYGNISLGNGDLSHTGGIAKNGTRINSFPAWKSISSGAGAYASSLVLNLAVGDYVEYVIYTSNTAQVDSNAQNAQPTVFWAYYLGA